MKRRQRTRNSVLAGLSGVFHKAAGRWAKSIRQEAAGLLCGQLRLQEAKYGTYIAKRTQAVPRPSNQAGASLNGDGMVVRKRQRKERHP